jgi:hypothetical protein
VESADSCKLERKSVRSSRNQLSRARFVGATTAKTVGVGIAHVWNTCTPPVNWDLFLCATASFDLDLSLDLGARSELFVTSHAAAQVLPMHLVNRCQSWPLADASTASTGCKVETVKALVPSRRHSLGRRGGLDHIATAARQLPGGWQVSELTPVLPRPHTDDHAYSRRRQPDRNRLLQRRPVRRRTRNHDARTTSNRRTAHAPNRMRLRALRGGSDRTNRRRVQHRDKLATSRGRGPAPSGPLIPKHQQQFSFDCIVWRGRSSMCPKSGIGSVAPSDRPGRVGQHHSGLCVDLSRLRPTDVMTPSPLSPTSPSCCMSALCSTRQCGCGQPRPRTCVSHAPTPSWAGDIG